MFNNLIEIGKFKIYTYTNKNLNRPILKIKFIVIIISTDKWLKWCILQTFKKVLWPTYIKEKKHFLTYLLRLA